MSKRAEWKKKIPKKRKRRKMKLLHMCTLNTQLSSSEAQDVGIPSPTDCWILPPGSQGLPMHLKFPNSALPAVPWSLGIHQWYLTAALFCSFTYSNTHATPCPLCSFYP